MAYNLEDLKNAHDFNLEKEVKAILDYLKKFWMIEAAPNDYEQYMKMYEDYQDMDDDLEESCLKMFKGHDGSSSMSFPFPVAVSKPHVAYEDCNQVNYGPLGILVRNLIIHGSQIGMRIADLEKKTDAHRKIHGISHAYNMSDHTDKELGEIYLQEFKAYLEDENQSYQEIHDKYEGKREELFWSRFITPFLDYTKKNRTFPVYHFMGNKLLSGFYCYIHSQNGSENRFNKFLEKIKPYGITVKKDGQYAFIIQRKKVSNGKKRKTRNNSR
jgi:hypothetical protein